MVGVPEIACVDVGDRGSIGRVERAPGSRERREVPRHRRTKIRSMRGGARVRVSRSGTGLAWALRAVGHVRIPEGIERPRWPDVRNLGRVGVGLQPVLGNHTGSIQYARLSSCFRQLR